MAAGVGKVHAARVRVVADAEAASPPRCTSPQADGPGRLADREVRPADYRNVIHQACRDGAATGVRDRRGRVGQDQAWQTGRTATMFSGITKARQVRPGWP